MAEHRHLDHHRRGHQASGRTDRTGSGAPFIGDTQRPVLDPSTRTTTRATIGAGARAGVGARAAVVLILIAVALGLGAPLAAAAPVVKRDGHLDALWTAVLATPDARNPFGSGGAAFDCLHLDDVVAPFGPSGVASCTVETGTRVFVAASAFECSTFEGNGSTDAVLRECARLHDAQAAPPLTLDGSSVAVTETETHLLRITLPAANIFGQPAGTTGLSVGHGWVALLHPLTPGTHTIVIGTGPGAIVTKIIVRRDR